MTLTEIRLRLDELGVHPSRRLGQNFLHDQNLASLIVEMAEIQPSQQVVEIGPGLGAITEFIEKKKAELSLIEKDHRLAGYIRSRFRGAQLIEGDALEKISDFQSMLTTALVLGNLPYSVASPLIVRLCESDLRPARMLFTIQLEVAERLVAEPQTKDYGLLTLLTRPFYKIKIARKIPKSVFWPQPEVDSALVSFVRQEVPAFPNQEADLRFRGMVKKAFQKRRKTLGAIFGKDSRFEPKRSLRPENLSVEDWVELALKSQPPLTPPNLPLLRGGKETAQEIPLLTKEGLGEVESLKPAEEIFDVVDQNDQVIGQERRSEVHRRNLYHRAVHIFIWNREGKLLLQKRSAHKDVSPNTWDSSAAGHLGAGEEYDAAAQREITEELGIELPLRKVKKLEVCENFGWEFVWLYEGRSEGPFRFPESEISELQWWSTAQIDRAIEQNPKDFARSFRHLWSLWKNEVR
jgi:16S rRNA (adenine1518-N6/adenine1519-N6)-dimethyltransferase